MRAERWLRIAALRLRSIFWRNGVEQDLDEELRFHLEQETAAHITRGLTPDEARVAALRAMDGVERQKDACRDTRHVAFVDHLLQDLRFAGRMMRRSPGFVCAAVMILGCTIAAVTTMLTLAQTLYFRDLPVDRPGEIVSVSATRRHGTIVAPISYPDYVDLRDATRTLKDLAAHYSSAPLWVSVNGASREMNGAVVTAGFFPLLGITPAAGRFFTPDEDRVPDRDRVAVLGYGLWRTAFGASPDALGAPIRINGVTFTIVGVAPETFRGIANIPNELFIPMMTLRVGYRWCDDALVRDCTILGMIGRLADGRRVEDARAEMTTLVPSAWAHAPEGENTSLTASRRRGMPSDQEDRRFLGLLAAVAIVLLLVCCANLAGLLLARTTARVRELSTRTKLGATRARVIRQLTTESLVLALAGAAAGVLLSMVLSRSVAAMFYANDMEGHPLNFDFSLDPIVLVAAVGASIVAGFLFGLFPAFKATSLSDGGTPLTPAVTARTRSGRWLVGVQTAVAVTLVAIAAMLSVSAHAMMSGANFDASRVALMRLRPRLVQYTPERAATFLRAALANLQAVPGVESVSMVGNGVALHGGAARVALPEADAARDSFRAGYIEIGPRYFETLRTPLVRGREFADRDTADSAPVAVVNETLARRLWPDGTAIGRPIVVNRLQRDVVGIVADVPLQTRTEPAASYVYIPFWQKPGQVDARLCVRVAGDPAGMLPALVRAVNGADPDVPIAETITLPVQMAGEFRPLRVAQTYVVYASVLALLLSAAGLYASVVYAVARRTKEIGIRKAIGARSTTIVRMVVQDGMTPILAGVAAGTAFAPLGVRLVRHLLYGPAAPNGLFYVGAAYVVAIVALVACWVPARRAARIDPIVALKCD